MTDEEKIAEVKLTEEQKNKLIDEVEDVLDQRVRFKGGNFEFGHTTTEREAMCQRCDLIRALQANRDYSMVKCDAIADAMVDFDYRECWVEMLVADGCTWYEAERRRQIEEVEDTLDNYNSMWRLTQPQEQLQFFEYLESHPVYYGA